MAHFKIDDIFNGGEDKKCFGCGDKPSAYWSGVGGEVYVCRQCAYSIFPDLLADTFYNEAGIYSSQQAQYAVNEFTKKFWSVLAFQLSKMLEKVKNQQSSANDRKNFLESTKLSRLPSLPKREIK